jgi:hypothetical protein
MSRQRALRAAVLIDAIRCLVGPGRMRDRRAHQTALGWILSRDAKAPFSFDNVCDALGLNSLRLRRSLLEPAFGADGVPQIAFAGESPAGAYGPPAIRRPVRERSRCVALDGAS